MNKHILYIVDAHSKVAVRMIEVALAATSNELDEGIKLVARRLEAGKISPSYAKRIRGFFSNLKAGDIETRQEFFKKFQAGYKNSQPGVDAIIKASTLYKNFATGSSQWQKFSLVEGDNALDKALKNILEGHSPFYKGERALPSGKGAVRRVKASHNLSVADMRRSLSAEEVKLLRDYLADFIKSASANDLLALYFQIGDSANLDKIIGRGA